MRGVCHLGPLARLRFPPLEIFAQRGFQPILPGLARSPGGLVVLVGHHGPIKSVGGRVPLYNDSSRAGGRPMQRSRQIWSNSWVSANWPVGGAARNQIRPKSIISGKTAALGSEAG